MSKKTLTNKSLHIYYSGSVQGVGFRYTAERLALSLKLTGWVKNLPDGRVEIICEGERSDIETFLQRLSDIFKIYIKDADMEWGRASGDFDTFDVRL